MTDRLVGKQITSLADVVRHFRDRKEADEARRAATERDEQERADRYWEQFVSELAPVMDHIAPGNYGQGMGASYLPRERTVSESFYCWKPGQMSSGAEGWGHRGPDEHLIIGDMNYKRSPHGIRVGDRYASRVRTVQSALVLVAKQLGERSSWAYFDEDGDSVNA